MKKLYDMAKTNVVLPRIRGARPHERSFDLVEQEYNAIQVGPARRITVEDNDRLIVNQGDDSVHPRLHALEDKVTQAIIAQNVVLKEQQKVTEAINHQQQMTQALIDKAFQNREEFLHNLSEIQGERLEDSTRHLLQDHIRYITSIVKRLNQDIEGLEAEIRARDHGILGTNAAVGKLEVHNVTSLQDLRGRIVRCDASIAKHSSDIRTCFGDIQRVINDQYKAHTAVQEVVHKMESQILALGGELEKLAGISSSDLLYMKKDARRDLDLSTERNENSLRDIKNALTLYKSSMSGDIDRIESRLASMVEKATSTWTQMLGKLESRLEDNVFSIQGRLSRVESAVARDRQIINNLHAVIENTVLSKLEDYSRYHQAELQTAKNEFREGFTSVHDSISNAKRVVEGKLKLQEDKLKKDVNQVRKLVVLH
ncbi:protein FAM81A-like isoform X1 [Mytilus trossulus]|uniref:protein FAM81A-like isoform X1 n=2 Tax=Mytilus trossulus TaxID=6551 RepID=UPI003007D905